MLSPGARLGPFEIVGPARESRGGEIYAARDRESGRDVAIHVFATRDGQDAAVRERCEAQVRARGVAIHLIGVDDRAVYVVADPIESPARAVSGPTLEPHMGHSRRTRAALVAAVVAGIGLIAVVLFMTRGRVPVERTAVGPKPASPSAPVAGAPSPPPIAEAPVEPAAPVAPDIPEVAAPAPAAPAEPRPAPVPPAEPKPAVPRAAPPAPPPSPPPAPSTRPLAPVVADGRDAASLVTEASVRATEFDLAGAFELVRAAAGRGDPGAQVAALYIRGLLDAREAFREGGPAERLAPIHEAITALGGIAKGRPGSAEIARLTLHAAAAAAQSERDEMSLYLETALEMESLQRMAGLPGAPLVPAAEVAGDLWLQVHRYEDARRAYADAAARFGSTLRVLSGLARAARRLNDIAAACASYRSLLAAWGGRPGLPVEIAEARAYVGGCVE